MKPKKLIEVALPIKEISAESVRDKSIRHGHISTLHLWWARRPLPVCRAIVFASLVPDPLDDNCPQAFKDAVRQLLNPGDNSITEIQYKPYTDIPYTAIVDPMEDNLRNRLMMFIGKFSDKCQDNMKDGKSTPPRDQLSDGSLIKWENKNNPRILRMARELIFVAYQSDLRPDASWQRLHSEFDKLYDAIPAAEDKLYSLIDRHIETEEVKQLELELQKSIDSFQQHMPSVFDPFAGGGAIPLEAARLGCRSYGNDINPVAHIIERGSAEFPQKYGKPIVYSKDEFKRRYGEKGMEMATDNDHNIQFDGDLVRIPNRLAFDVEFYAKQILEETEQKVGYLYPADKDGNKLVAYYWARIAKCSNPSCGAEVPMLKQFYLAKTSKKKVYLNPIINGTDIQFEIKNGSYSNLDGWNNRGNITCPCCGSVTSVDKVKEQSIKYGLKERLIAVIYDGDKGKSYKLPTIKQIHDSNKQFILNFLPNEEMARNSGGGDTHPWGFTHWNHLFTKKQLYVLNILVEKLLAISETLPKEDYFKIIKTYIAMWIDKALCFYTSFCTWHVTGEKMNNIFARQAIPMIFDFVEANIVSGTTGSLKNMLEWITLYINSESSISFPSSFANSSSGEKSQFNSKYLTASVTDPPYYDAIAYADISDFFYVWLKNILGEDYPLTFSTPKTPKIEECTALKHYHNNSEQDAKRHFENKLTQIFDAIGSQTSDIVSIMYAHQSTEAWTTLCNSILGARMNITGSWPMDTEMMGALKTDKAFLESSVTVACRPSERRGYGDYREVKKAIEQKVAAEVESLYELGFRGADLLTACFGQAVSEFGRYKTVEKSDGSEVTVAELLDMARNAAFDALLKGVEGDDFTKFYIGWLQLNGVGEVDFDDATKFTRVGVNVNINDIKQEGLLILEGKKMHIAMAEEHLGKSPVEGTRPTDSPITQAHRAILLYRNGDRAPLLRFVRDICPEVSSPLWRLLATLKELLPACDDLKQVQGFLQNADDLRQHCHEQYVHKQQTLQFED